MESNHKSSSKKGKSFAFWKKTPSKTPGSIKQVRGAQYPPIISKNNPYQNASGKSSKKRKSATITLKVSSMSDNYKNYKHTVYPPLESKKAVDDSVIPDHHHSQSAQSPIDMNELIQSVKEERQKQLREMEEEERKRQSNGHSDKHNPSSSNHLKSQSHSNGNGLHNENDTDSNPNPTLSDEVDHKDNNDSNVKILKHLKVDTQQHSQSNHHDVSHHPNSPPKSPIYSSIDPSQIVEWDEMKNDGEAFARKNRNRINLLTKMLENAVLDSTSIRKACWRGIPKCMRPQIWKLLLGYTPKNLSRRQMTLQKKRGEYYDLMERYYNQTQKEHRSDQENKIVHQIGLDVPRTSPELKLFQIECINNLLSRALYIWALKHTATGYVQGINDLITPFVYIFLDEYLQENFNGISLTDFEISRQIIKTKLTEKMLLKIEADSYWCLDYLIEGLQLNYTDNQPGIYHMVSQLEDVIKRVNEALYKHFESENVEIFQFSFRWMNCLLMRELSLQNIIRLWDTYFCEGVELSAGFSEFHVFVCAALLLSFADLLMKKDFAETMLFLQDLPSVTAKWGERQIETILSEAYVYQQLFGKHKKSLY